LYTILDADLDVVGILDLEGKGCKFYNDLRSTKIADDQGKIWSDTLTLSVPYGYRETEYMTQGYHLLKEGSDGHLYCYRIFDWEDSAIGPTHVKTVQAINLLAWDLWHKNVPAKKFSLTSTSDDVFPYILQQTGWEINDTDFFGEASSLEISAGNNAMYWLDQFARDFSVEIRAFVQIYNGKIVRKLIDIVSELGESDGRRFEYSHDLVGVSRKGSDQEMYTKLFVYGGSDKNGNPVSISSVNDGRAYIVDDDANDIYNNGGEYLEGYIVNDSITNPNGLLTWGEGEMAKWNHPKYTYAIDVAHLNFIPSLGDHVQVLDFSMEPELTVSARVLQLDESEANPINDKVILGEFIEIAAVTPDVIWELQAKASRAAQAAEKAKAYKVEYFTPDGTDFSNGVTQKRIIIRVYDGKENVTASIDESKFVWQKINADGSHDDAWEDMMIGAGNVITIGSDVIGSTIRCQVDDGIGDPIIFATEEDAALFTTLQMDAPSGWTDFTQSIAQYAQFDYPRGHIYWSQKYRGDKRHTGDSTASPEIESYVITRTDLNGTPIDRMWCIRGGHGSHFGIEYVGSTMWIWSYYLDVANNQWWVVKFPYVANKILDWGDSSIVKMINTGEKFYRVNLDARNGYVLLTTGRINPYIHVCKKSDIENKIFKSVYSARGSDIGFFGTDQSYQSACLDYPYVYMASGDLITDYDQRVLYCFDIRSKSLVYRIVYTFDKGTINQIANYNEPEAITYYYDSTGKKWLLQGFSFGNENIEETLHTNQLFRIEEHKRGET
jgi:phage minor structural protein